MDLIEKYLGEGFKDYHFRVFKKGLDGKLSNKEHLNSDEFDKWMKDNYGKTANIRVERSDGNWVEYTDSGKKWEATKKGKGKKF